MVAAPVDLAAVGALVNRMVNNPNPVPSPLEGKGAFEKGGMGLY